METPAPLRRRWTCLALLAAWALLAVSGDGRPCLGAEAAIENLAGELEFDGHSDYSHIRVRRRGTVRSLLFVRDGGEEVLETQIDLRKPEVLKFEYLRNLFASYLFREQQEDVLIIGLGGGGMVHFLQHLDKNMRIDAVEIDPLVVRLAGDLFGVRSQGNVNIVTADGLKFITESDKQYDAIYMDAFLKPSAETDGTGAPLALRTQQFYQQLQSKLKPGGVVAFNLNPHPELEADVRAIAEAFPQTYVFPLTRFQGVVVVASTSPERVAPTELTARGRALNRRFKTSLDFQELARRIDREGRQP